jgi:hypothetical protein
MTDFFVNLCTRIHKNTRRFRTFLTYFIETRGIRKEYRNLAREIMSSFDHVRYIITYLSVEKDYRIKKREFLESTNEYIQILTGLILEIKTFEKMVDLHTFGGDL